jgi:hypothetical protein
MMFVSESGRAGYATTDADGRFEAQTIEPNDGILIGPSVVVLASRVAPSFNTKSALKGLTEEERALVQTVTTPFPDKYRSALTSPLRVQVEAGKVNEFHFELSD